MIRYANWAERMRGKYPEPDAPTYSRPSNWNQSPASVNTFCAGFIYYAALAIATGVILTGKNTATLPFWSWWAMWLGMVPIVVLLCALTILFSLESEGQISLRAFFIQPLVYKKYVFWMHFLPLYTPARMIFVILLTHADNVRDKNWIVNHPMRPEIEQAQLVIERLKMLTPTDESYKVLHMANEVMNKAKNFTVHKQKDESRIQAANSLREIVAIGERVKLGYDCHDELMASYHRGAIESAFGDKSK